MIHKINSLTELKPLQIRNEVCLRLREEQIRYKFGCRKSLAKVRTERGKPGVENPPKIFTPKQLNKIASRITNQLSILFQLK